MAQYYQVTSLEELHKLYPNLQLDNLEGIPCMIQDDQVTQYTDKQGQQVIATVEQTGMQLSHNPGPSQQCSPQQSQFVVHQPTQYVIHQKDVNESQTTTVQYIQQPAQKNEEIPVPQYKDHTVRCITTEIGKEEHSLQPHVVQQETARQCLPQVQPVLQQPIKMHPQIQALDMGGNILVLQKQEQQELNVNQAKSQELVLNSLETQQPQQQPQHILIQMHQQQKPQQIIAQKIIQKSENSEECAQKQVLQNQHLPQGGSQQQQQLIHQPQQQIIQPLQYFNQVTVIDNFTQPKVNIEHHSFSNENLLQQQQVQTQIQQFRPKKNVQQAGLSTIIQQPQVLVPQRFGMTSPPPLRNSLPQNKRKVLQHEIETPSAPVFIVQKVESPFLIRQQQPKIRFQGQQPCNEKPTENSYQSISTQSEQQIVEQMPQENQQVIPVSTMSLQQAEAQKKMSVSDQITQSPQNKCSPESNINFSQVKIGILEQPFEARAAEQMTKLKVCTPLAVRTSVAKIKTVEQQTDPGDISDGKEVGSQQLLRFGGSTETQSRQLPTLHSEMQPVEIKNSVQISPRGRGMRGHSPRGYHCFLRGRGVQVQTPSPRMPGIERGGINRRIRSPRGRGKVGRGGWTPGVSEQCQAPLGRMSVQQVSPNLPNKTEASQTSNEVVEETKMVVLLINGEKKIVKIPSSQNILLGQLLQQAGLSLSSPTPITIEQVVDNSSDHTALKNTAGTNQQLVTVKPATVTQVLGVPGTPGTPRSIVATIQQRPRLQSPFSSPQASNVGIIRHRLHFGSPRMTAASFSGPPTVTSNAASETIASQSQNAQTGQTSTPPLAKEEPRFVTGFMAICPFCGISSLDFNKCIRCRRKLPENVKSQSIFSAKKKKEKANGSNEKVEDSNSDAEEKQSDLSGTEGKDKCDKKRLKPCIKKKKISDEPAEILILSSDEEEESKTKKTGTNASTLTVLKKEPVYTETLTESEVTNMLKKNNLSEDLMKNVQPGSFTTLQCRTIRIGSYKIQPKERIFMSSRGIRLLVNSLKNELCTIVIPTSDILKVLVHFGKHIPVIFIYPLPKIGQYIREMLGMDSKTGPYYDPTSTQEETHKRITLLLEKVTEDHKIAINKIFGQEKLEELSEKEANAILIRASPIDTQSIPCKPTDSVRKIMVYPPPPEKGGITLNNQDYACLGEDQFLNDVIIDFYLKYLMLKVLSPADRNRTHVFSTFFYKRLTTKPKSLRKNDPENDPKLSPAEKRHMRVKGWTKQVNLFEKDFIIVPINEHSHWFLAIICFPGLTGPVRFSDNTPVEPEEVVPKKNCRIVQIGNTTITHIIKADGNTISLEMDSGSDRDEAEGDQDDLHPSSDDEGSEQQVEEETNTPPPVQIPLLAPTPQPPPSAKDTKAKPAKRKLYKEPIKQPCILIFDSLAGASRVRVVATLRDYLKIEYKKKMGHERDFSKDTIKGAVPKVPQQNNFTDCGLYVLQYVESFFQDPLHDFKLPLKYLQDWFPEEIVSSKRQKLASLIRSLMEEQGIKVEEMGLPVLTFTIGNNAGDEQSRVEEDEVEDEEELNEEDEEILRNNVQIAEFDNEEEEDLNVEEEDDLEDDEDEENDEEDEDDDYDEEELEVGEIPRQWLVRASGSCELEPSVKHGGPVVFKTSGLVEYDPSDSDEDNQNVCANSIVISGSQTTNSEASPEKEYCEVDQAVVPDNRKTVPLSEFLDFESQISCTTIERNVEGRNNESEANSEGETEEEQCRATADEEETSSEKANVTTEGFNESTETETCRPNEVLAKDNKIVEVSDIIKKLMNDKNITLKRKENDMDSNIFRKHLDAKRIKVKDCDDSENATSPSSPPKTNSEVYKRPYQTLKSVRIPKKTERNLDLCSKRQKVDER